MKTKWIKTSLNKLMAGILGMVLLISSSCTVQARTSDQVTLSVTKPGAGYVNTQSGSLNVRETASTSAKVIASLPKGSTVMIVERCSSGFYKVQYDTYGHYGYVSDKYIYEYDLDYYCIANTTTSLNMRSGRGTSYGVVASIPSQKRFPILLEIDDWDYVLYGNKDGYVSTKYIIKHRY